MRRVLENSFLQGEFADRHFSIFTTRSTVKGSTERKNFKSFHKISTETL